MTEDQTEAINRRIDDQADAINRRLDDFSNTLKGIATQLDKALNGNGQKGLFERVTVLESGLSDLKSTVEDGRKQRNFHIKWLYGLVAGLIVAWATAWFTKLYTAESATTEKTTIEKVVVPK